MGNDRQVHGAARTMKCREGEIPILLARHTDFLSWIGCSMLLCGYQRYLQPPLTADRWDSSRDLILHVVTSKVQPRVLPATVRDFFLVNLRAGPRPTLGTLVRGIDLFKLSISDKIRSVQIEIHTSVQYRVTNTGCNVRCFKRLWWYSLIVENEVHHSVWLFEPHQGDPPVWCCVAGADPGYVKRGGRDPKGGAGWLI